MVISLVTLVFSLECLSESWFQEGYHETEHNLFLSWGDRDHSSGTIAAGICKELQKFAQSPIDSDS